MTRGSEPWAIVAGLGPSLDLLAETPWEMRPTVIGVNDAESRIECEHLVVLDPPSSFRDRSPEGTGEARIRTVLDTRAAEVWIVANGLEGGWGDLTARRPVWDIRLIVGVPDAAAGLDYPDRVYSYQTSPFAATTIAYRLGAGRIGLIGVDLTPDHNLGGRGTRSEIARKFAGMHDELKRRGVDLVNLSPLSSLCGVPNEELSTWLRNDHTSLRSTTKTPGWARWLSPSRSTAEATDS